MRFQPWEGIIGVVLVVLALAGLGVATGNLELPKQLIQGERVVGVAPAEAREWTRVEIVLSVASLAFGLIALWMVLSYISNTNRQVSSEELVRLVGLTVIVPATLCVLAAGYSSQQLAPAMAILGSVAGYTLGSTNRQQPPPPTPPTAH